MNLYRRMQMKKLLGVLLAAMFVILPAAAVHSDDYDNRKVWMNKDEFIMCFDRITLVTPEGEKSQVQLWGVSDGSAQNAIDAHPVYFTEETDVVCYGWSGLKSGVSTASYGYRLNEGSPVFSDGFKVNAENAVFNAGGDSRYRVTAPVKETDNPTLITIVSKDVTGTVRDLLEFSVNGEYVPADERPVSPSQRVFGKPDNNKLNLVISGGSEVFQTLPEKEFIAEISLTGNVFANKADLLIHYDPSLTYVDTDFPVSGKDKGSTVSAANDPATHTLRIKWTGKSGIYGDFTLAKPVFKADKDTENEFLHISADSDVSSIKRNSTDLDLNIINGGADVVAALWGDVDRDGQAGNKDVVKLFRYVSDADRDINVSVADTNGDKEINNKDVIILFRVLSGAEKVDLSYTLTPATYEQTTERVNNVRSWTFNDGTAGNVIGVYCETEQDADVLICDESGTVLVREHSLYGSFYGRFILPEGKQSQKVYLYAQTDGKNVSKSSRAYTLSYSDSVGSGAIIGKDSHVYLNYYKAHYVGQAAVPGNEQQAAGRMNNIKNKLYDKLAQVRARTGKNTKIIILVCTNPATIYHDLQYSEAEKGWGDYDLPTSVTQFGEFMKDDENIYMLDMRQILSEHKDKLLFMQADSHWTSIAAYYGYYLAANRIKNDFPSTKVYDLEKDFNVNIAVGGGDLLNFMGASGAHAVSASVSAKSESMYASSNAPTAYVMGDSYYWGVSGYLNLLFSNVYLNDPPTNPPLYDYTLDDLESKKPDYLFYVWTERNVDASLSWFESTIVNGG